MATDPPPLTLRRVNIGSRVSEVLAHVRERPTYANHLKAFAAIRKAEMSGQRRVAIVADFTAEPLAKCLDVQMHLAGVPTTTHVTPAREHSQQVLDSASDLYDFGPDTVIVLLSPHAAAPGLREPGVGGGAARERPSSDVDALQPLLQTLRQRTPAVVFVANLVHHERSPLGMLDWQHEHGLQRALDEMNGRLADCVGRQERMYVFDLAGLCAEVGRERVFDPRMRLVADQPFATSFLPRLGAELARYLQAVTGPSRKCLVLDLDNTLWGGTLAEEGPEKLRLGGDAIGEAYRDFQRAVLGLHDRGILLAVCSRNDERDAVEVLNRHPDMLVRGEHIAAMRIGWGDKVEGLQELASELNIGLDSFVFIDDDPFERQNVRERLPEVLVPDVPSDPVLRRAMLLELHAFDTLRLTDEDRSRGRMYQERRAREALRGRASSLEEYLTSLDMEIAVRPPEGPFRTRMFQLVHKTNRFNLTSRRYSEAEFAALTADPAVRVLGIHVKDRLGDNGVVGVVVVRFAGPACDIETFLLSCRVMGRRIETAILAYVADVARARRAARLLGRYVPTPKNANVRGFYETHGFQFAGREGEAEVWQLDLETRRLEPPTWASVHD